MVQLNTQLCGRGGGTHLPCGPAHMGGQKSGAVQAGTRAPGDREAPKATTEGRNAARPGSGAPARRPCLCARRAGPEPGHGAGSWPAAGGPGARAGLPRPRSRCVSPAPRMAPGPCSTPRRFCNTKTSGSRERGAARGCAPFPPPGPAPPAHLAPGQGGADQRH